ncbi:MULTISPECIES: GntR family transcriptional regulator [Paraburkholderia]|uniref:GntR family transcriptional regulator n=1 Tax=Paraburkholderia podalyriae TaxID=1938811 RepID=A0ABR7PU53_9BURK|nr:GntR family transcriptional regulator [Paraburkholderia podalyriae]MBC8749782.1 GntR family transcriptional regulator [Paraburkholderia podalyriae]
MSDGMKSTAWERVMGALKADIANGSLQPGASLPPESELASRFDVGRGTIRRALTQLQADGYVRTERGLGSFVDLSPYPYDLARESRFSHTLDGMGVVEERQTVRNELVKADGRIGKLLGVPSSDKLALIEVLSFAGGLPLLLAANYIPADRFPGIGDTYNRKQSLSASLRLYDMTVQERTHTEIQSRLPSPNEAKLFRQSRSQPITEVENVVVDQHGNPSWVEVLCFAASRVRLVLDRGTRLP